MATLSPGTMVTRVIRGVEADGSLGFARCALSLSGLCTKLVVPKKTLWAVGCAPHTELLRLY